MKQAKTSDENLRTKLNIAGYMVVKKYQENDEYNYYVVDPESEEVIGTYVFGKASTEKLQTIIDKQYSIGKAYKRFM